MVSGFLCYVHEAWIVKGRNHLGRSVGGIVVDHYYIIGEVRLLGERRTYGVAYGAHPVAAGYHDRRLELETASGAEVDILEDRGQVAAYGLEMSRAGPLHFYLHFPRRGVHIVEELLPGAAQVFLVLVIEVFANMHELPLSRKAQPQVVQTGVAIVRIHFRGRPHKRGVPHQQHAAEIEVVTQRAFLPVDDRPRFEAAVHTVDAVGIQEHGPGVVRKSEHTLPSSGNPFRKRGAGTYETIFSAACGGYPAYVAGGRTQRDIEDRN